MKSLMSVNVSKFLPISPNRLVELIKMSKYTNGVEVYVAYNEIELKYLDDLVFELKKNDLILQVHGNVELEYDKQVNFVKKLEEYSSYLGYPIIYTLHTIYDDDLEVSLSKTVDYISNLLTLTNNVIVCLENLNCMRNYARLDKDGIRSFVLNDERLFFTYDIGHVIADYGDVADLDEYMFEDIRNVHIHTYDDKGEDHQPIYKGDAHWNMITKALIFLKLNNYKYNIVYEYDLYACYGDTLEEQVIDFLKSIDMVSQKYND